jgi:membrane protease YdiL (CAAX protease family)
MFVTDDRRPALLWRVVGYAILFGGCLSLRGPLESGLERVVAQLDAGLLRPVLVQSMVVAVVIGAVIGVTFLFRRFVDRRPWEGMTMPPPWRRWRGVLAGFWLGAAMIFIVFGIEYSLGWIRINGVKDGFAWEAVIAMATARFIHFIATAVCEEVAYRSYLLQNVAERFPIWIAVLVTGGVFASSHFSANGFTWGFVVGGIVASFFLALMRFLTRSIWLGVGWHLGWDWIEDGTGLVPGYSALATQQVGPPLWVGQGLAIEGGLLITLILLAGLGVLLCWSRYAGRAVDWGAKLNEDGMIQDRLCVIGNAVR